MSENISQRKLLAALQVFEASLSLEQQLLLLQHPQLIHPELRLAFFQFPHCRMTSTQLDTNSFDITPTATGDKKVEGRRLRKVVNSWMAFRSK